MVSLLINMQLQIYRPICLRTSLTTTQPTSHKESCSTATQQGVVIPHDDTLVGSPRVLQFGWVHLNPDYHSLMIGPSTVSWRWEINVHEALVSVQGRVDHLLVVIVIGHNGFTGEESDTARVGVLVLGRLREKLVF